MSFPGTYACLSQQVYSSGDYALVPIQFEDRYAIMQWRNEQLYHLRQHRRLEREDQDAYFRNVVGGLFGQPQPAQILFSFLKDGQCVGYGGLVHINWIDLNAEVSFLMNTTLETTDFESFWLVFLELLQQVAFEVLQFHKLYTFALDLRPRLYPVLQEAGFVEEARLRHHCRFDAQFVDVVIHSKFRVHAN